MEGRKEETKEDGKEGGWVARIERRGGRGHRYVDNAMILYLFVYVSCIYNGLFHSS